MWPFNAILIRPKHTVADAARTLVVGLEDGSIVLPWEHGGEPCQGEAQGKITDAAHLLPDLRGRWRGSRPL